MSKETVVAGVVIINTYNNILLVKKQGFWFFPGGKTESGENLCSTLYRELQEELGLKLIKSPDRIHRGNFQVINGKSYLIHTFACDRSCVKGRPHLNPNDSVVAYMWTKDFAVLNLTAHARFILSSFY